MKEVDKKKKTVNNLIYGFGTKVLTMILGILIPRLFIVSYGSETNGLLSTITQIFTYLALLQAGIGNATINALYKPLDDKNWHEINEVFSQARSYYRRVAVIYAGAVFGFSVIYTVLAKSTLDKTTVFAIIILQGMSSFITYYFCASYTQLLIADGKQYVSDNITFIIHVATSISKIVLVSLGFNVLVVQEAYLAISIFTVPVTIYFCKKMYPSLEPHKTKEKGLLQERGAFIVHELSAVIFSNTDIFVISTFCNLAMASVYSVYNLVFGALNSMINTANAGLGFLLGQNIYKEQSRLIKVYDIYSSLYSMIVFIVMTTAYVLMTPFVKIYTRGVRDVNYIIPGLAFLFVLVNLMSGVRAVGARLITVSGHADATKSHSILEMVINLVSSLILVNIYGIFGVLIGTVIALLYRMNDIIIYANKIILKRSPIHEYAQIIANSAIFGLIMIVNNIFRIQIKSYFMLVIFGGCIFCVCGILYLIPLIIVNKDSLLFIIKKLRKKNTNN